MAHLYFYTHIWLNWIHRQTNTAFERVVLQKSERVVLQNVTSLDLKNPVRDVVRSLHLQISTGMNQTEWAVQLPRGQTSLMDRERCPKWWNQNV
jgi:hypothetical protein